MGRRLRRHRRAARRFRKCILAHDGLLRIQLARRHSPVIACGNLRTVVIEGNGLIFAQRTIRRLPGRVSHGVKGKPCPGPQGQAPASGIGEAAGLHRGEIFTFCKRSSILAVKVLNCRSCGNIRFIFDPDHQAFPGIQHQSLILQGPFCHGAAIVIPEAVLIQIHRLASRIVNFEKFISVGVAYILRVGDDFRNQQRSRQLRVRSLLVYRYALLFTGQGVDSVGHIYLENKTVLTLIGCCRNRYCKSSCIFSHGILFIADLYIGLCDQTCQIRCR